MNKILLILSINCCNFVFGQDLRGLVIDRTTKEPIPFAHIISENSTYGIVSSIEGDFILPKRFDGTAFTISALGYEPYKFDVSRDFLNQPINLIPKSYSLKEIVINSPKYKKKWLNDFNNPKFGVYGIRNGGEVATFIDESDLFPQARLQKISVYIHNVSSNNYLRLHIYDYNILCSCPGIELLDTNYIISGGYNNEWVDIDVRNSFIEIPENGIFVSIEGLRTETQNRNDTLELGGFSKPEKFGNHTFRKNFLGNWKGNKTVNFKVINVLNLAVKTEIVFDKKRTRKKLNSEKSSLKFKPLSKGKIKKLFDSRNVSVKTEYPNNSFKSLVNSVIQAIKSDDIPYMVNHLFVFDKDSRDEVLVELKKRKEEGQWISSDERQEIIAEWEEILNHIENAKFIKIDSDKFKVEFPDVKNTIVYVQFDGNKWKMLSKHYTGQP